MQNYSMCAGMMMIFAGLVMTVAGMMYLVYIIG